VSFEFSLLYSFRNPPGEWQRPWKQLYDELFDHIATMEQIGIDVISVTEHHFSEDGYLPSLTVMTAALAMRTSRVTISQGIIEVPLHHPVALAEDLAVCDILSGGRLRVGVGMGRMDDWRPSYAHEGMTFGAPLTPKERAPLFEEQLEIIRKCWGGPFRHQGAFYDFPEIDVTPKPLRAGGPEIWFGVTAPAAMRRAARMGNGLSAGPQLIEYYLEQVRIQGRQDVAAQYEASFNRYPASDPERAEAIFGKHLDYLWKWYGMPSNPWAPPRFVEPAVLAEEVRAARALGATGARWHAPFAGAAPADTLEIFASLVEDVKPLVEAD
jgi:alkanesulfonate monooxygenase SsuD/methylene tetrahydromethanopterin reductase-like flavin-dependent oxidoreductase (luciferase family)